MPKDTSRQIPLDLAHETAYGREDFFASACNAAALAWIDRWPDWPAPALVIHGPPGCGKTHLSHIWQEKAGALRAGAAAPLHGLRPAPRALVLDDAGAHIGDREGEETLFHLYNLLKEQGGHMLLTAETPPGEWGFALPDLRSRLLAAPSVAVERPDDALVAVVVSKMFSDRQIHVSPDAIAYILPRVERSFPALRALVEAADRMALAEKRAITVPLLREYFASSGKE